MVVDEEEGVYVCCAAEEDAIFGGNCKEKEKEVQSSHIDKEKRVK